MSEAIAAVVSVLIVVFGISYVVSPDPWLKLLREGVDEPHKFYPIALVILVVGLLVITTHNEWSPLWRAIITFFGWAMAIKGALYLAVPALTKKMAGGVLASWGDSGLRLYMRFAGVVMIVVGAWLTYKSWCD